MSKLNFKSLSILYSDSISKNMTLGFLLWFAGFLTAFYIYNGIITDEKTLIQNQESIISKSTLSYFKTNFIVFNLIVFGFISLSISSYVILYFNGLILGYFFHNHLITSNLIETAKLIIPHFTEIIGFILAFHLSIIISKTIINDFKNFINHLRKRFIKIYIIGTLLILIGAFCEANITILFL